MSSQIVLEQQRTCRGSQTLATALLEQSAGHTQCSESERRGDFGTREIQYVYEESANLELDFPKVQTGSAEAPVSEKEDEAKIMNAWDD